MAIVYYPKGQFIAQRTTLDPFSASYDQLILACSPNTVLYFDTASTATIVSASNLQITSSWAEYAVSTSYADVQTVSSSWASSSITASALESPYFSYTTLLPSLSNWFTCSFADQNEFISLGYTASFYFTHSAPPAAGQMADLVIVISSSASPTASLIFPSQWKPLGGQWPSFISASRIGIITLRAIDANLVVGSYTQTLF